MYAVQINDDNSMTAIINQRISQGYKLADWFWFFVKPYYQDINMSDYNASIEFILPVSQKVITEKLILKSEMYEDYLKYSISSKSKITNEAGVVQVKVIFRNASDEIVRETSYLKIGISTTTDWHNDTQYDETKPNDGNSGSGCNCNDDEHIAKLIEQIRPLVFDSVESAESKINSDDATNIYLGQSVIVVNNGKYLLYSIQNGENGRYAVEPVDTYGEGAVWVEE